MEYNQTIKEKEEKKKQESLNPCSNGIQSNLWLTRCLFIELLS